MSDIKRGPLDAWCLIQEIRTKRNKDSKITSMMMALIRYRGIILMVPIISIIGSSLLHAALDSGKIVMPSITATFPGISYLSIICCACDIQHERHDCTMTIFWALLAPKPAMLLYFLLSYQPEKLLTNCRIADHSDVTALVWLHCNDNIILLKDMLILVLFL